MEDRIKMQDRIETIIRDWLNKEFKNSNAIPGPMLKGLAEEIDKHRWEIYENARDEYDFEDIDIVADNNGVELTEDERTDAFYRYRKVQQYESSINELDEIVKYIIEKRKEKK